MKEPSKLQATRKYITFIWGTLVFDFDLLKIRHLAAENGSNSSVSTVGICWSSILLDEINLEPDFFLFWMRLLVEKTPRGVWMIKTVSGFGALHQKQNHEQKILIRLWKTQGRVESAHEPITSNMLGCHVHVHVWVWESYIFSLTHVRIQYLW